MNTNNIFDDGRDDELCREIMMRENEQKDKIETRKYKVEHFYINFSFYILGQKLKQPYFKMD